MAQQSVELHVRPKAAYSSGLWTRDDAIFMISAPFLLGAAIFCPETKWNEIARLIDSRSNFRRSLEYSPKLASVTEKLNINSNGLQQIIATSRVNQIENLIINFHSLVRKEWRPKFEISGRQHLDQAVSEGKGAVLWVAHFAFASLLTKMALSQAGYRISHISRPEHGVSKSKFGMKYLNWFRCKAENRNLNVRIIYLRHQPQLARDAALAALGRNELLSITVGAWEGRHLATGELLGSHYTISAGVPKLAFRTGAKLLSVFTTRNAETGNYEVTVGTPLAEQYRSSEEEFIRASAHELMIRHEVAIRKAPEQWRGWGKVLG
jgi:lauroyl/myristoyl acyltransferase